MPNFAIVHTKGTQHFAILRHDWSGPSGPEPTLQNNASEVGPIRMRKDVGDEDWLPKVSGCAARSDTRTNARSIGRCPVRLRRRHIAGVTRLRLTGKSSTTFPHCGLRLDG